MNSLKRDRQAYTILAIDDNPGDLLLIEDYLDEQMINPTLLQARSFNEAKEIIRANRNKIQMILLDLTLPDLSGETLIKEIIAYAYELPIIVLTGYTDISFAIKTLSLGASDYLLKDDLSSSMLYKSIIYNLERKKQVEKLKESEKRYSELFHISPEPMWVYDLDTLMFLDINKAALLQYGYTLEEFKTMTIADLRPSEGLSNYARLTEVMNTKGPHHFRGTSVHQRKDGSLIHVELCTNFLMFQNREAQLVLANDITDKVRYINAIEEQNQKLRDIAWTQSHIVRAPVARILGLINLISTQAVAPHEVNEILKHIKTAAQEMDQVVRDITLKTNDVTF